MLISCVKTIYLYVCYEKFMCLKLNTFSKIVTQFLLSQNANLSLEIWFSVYEITYLWNSSLSINCVSMKNMLCLWNVLSMNFFICEMLSLWNVLSMIVLSMKCSTMKSAIKSFFCKLQNSPQTFAVESGNPKINLIWIPAPDTN